MAATSNGSQLTGRLKVMRAMYEGLLKNILSEKQRELLQKFLDNYSTQTDEQRREMVRAASRQAKENAARPLFRGAPLRVTYPRLRDVKPGTPQWNQVVQTIAQEIKSNVPVSAVAQREQAQSLNLSRGQVEQFNQPKTSIVDGVATAVVSSVIVNNIVVENRDGKNRTIVDYTVREGTDLQQALADRDAMLKDVATRTTSLTGSESVVSNGGYDGFELPKSFVYTGEAITTIDGTRLVDPNKFAYQGTSIPFETAAREPSVPLVEPELEPQIDVEPMDWNSLNPNKVDEVLEPEFTDPPKDNTPFAERDVVDAQVVEPSIMDSFSPASYEQIISYDSIAEGKQLEQFSPQEIEMAKQKLADAQLLYGDKGEQTLREIYKELKIPTNEQEALEYGAKDPNFAVEDVNITRNGSKFNVNIKAKSTNDLEVDDHAKGVANKVDELAKNKDLPIKDVDVSFDKNGKPMQANAQQVQAFEVIEVQAIETQSL